MRQEPETQTTAIVTGLEALNGQMKACGACDLCRTRTQVVPGKGSPNPLLMIVGEAPGEDEDIQGVPFIGKAGEKLNKILKYVGVTRDEVYITNSVLCRPPNNRNPRPEELEACRWRLILEIQLLKPQLIIALGRVATQQIKGEPIKGALSQFFPENVKGRWMYFQTGTHEAKLLVSYHPSYHLRSPERAYRVTLPHWTQVKQWVADARQTR
jgi:uracil-DNA glycosylase family 4